MSIARAAVFSRRVGLVTEVGAGRLHWLGSLLFSLIETASDFGVWLSFNNSYFLISFGAGEISRKHSIQEPNN